MYGMRTGAVNLLSSLQEYLDSAGKHLNIAQPKRFCKKLLKGKLYKKGRLHLAGLIQVSPGLSQKSGAFRIGLVKQMPELRTGVEWGKPTS